MNRSKSRGSQIKSLSENSLGGLLRATVVGWDGTLFFT